METYDDILKISGKFGLYQWRTYFFMCLGALQTCILTFSDVFIGATGEFWCRGSKFETDACLNASSSVENCDRLQEVSVCIDYNFTFHEDEEELHELQEAMKCQNGWEFDHGVYPSTFTEEWGLVCDKSAVTNILQSIYLAGLLFGCILFSIMADRFGRYITFIVCLICAALFTLLSALSPNAIIFAIIRFFAGASAYGLSTVAFVMAAEMVLPTTRVYTGVFIWFAFSVGYFLLSIFGKFIPSWRLFIVATAAPFALMLPSIVYVDESPRWLITKERYEDADKIIQKIAKVNKKTLPPDYMTKIRESKELKASSEVHGSFLDVIRNPVLRLYFINILYNWFVQSLVYFGLSLSTNELGVDVFVAFCISGAAEIPAHASSVLTLKYLGRKIATGGLMLLAGSACIATILSPPGALRVTFAMIGKFAITSSFDNIYIFAAEIFPTPVRSRSVGFCSMATPIGAVIAPLILVFEKFWGPLPLVLFGASAVLAGLLVFFLPETKGKPMPDTIEDSLNLKKRVRSEDSTTEKAQENESFI